MDFIHLKHVSDRENSKKLCQHQRIQDRKIFRLCTGQKSSANSFNPDDVVFNFSSRLISDKEKEILSKGLNFAVPPTRLNVCSFLTPFEKFYNLLKQEPVDVRSGFSQILLKGNSTVKTNRAQINVHTFNKLFPKNLGPNHFSKGEIVRQSSQIIQISTPCCSFPCRRKSGQRPECDVIACFELVLFSQC